MAYATKYTASAYGLASVQWRVELLENGYSGSVTELDLVGDGIKIGYDREEDRFNHVYSRYAIISLKAKTTFNLDTLQFDDERKFQCNIYKNNVLEFVGWLVPFYSQEEFEDVSITTIDVMAKDSIKQLANIEFYNQYPEREDNKQSFKEIISLGLKELGYPLYLEIYYNKYDIGMYKESMDCPLSQSYVDIYTFREENGTWLDFYTCIERILIQHDLRLFQAMGKWIIVSPIELTDGSVTGRRFEPNYGFYMSTVTLNSDQIVHTGGLKVKSNSIRRKDIPFQQFTGVYEYGLLGNLIPNGDLIRFTGDTPDSFTKEGDWYEGTTTDIIGGGIMIDNTYLRKLGPNAQYPTETSPDPAFLKEQYLLSEQIDIAFFRAFRFKADVYADDDIDEIRITLRMTDVSSPGGVYYVDGKGNVYELPTSIFIQKPAENKAFSIDVEWNNLDPAFPFRLRNVTIMEVLLHAGIRYRTGEPSNKKVKFKNLELTGTPYAYDANYKGRKYQYTNSNLPHSAKSDAYNFYFNDDCIDALSNFKLRNTTFINDSGLKTTQWKRTTETIHRSLIESVLLDRLVVTSRFGDLFDIAFKGYINFFNTPVLTANSQRFLILFSEYNLQKDETDVVMTELYANDIDFSYNLYDIFQEKEIDVSDGTSTSETGAGENFDPPITSIGGGTAYGVIHADGGIDSLPEDTDDPKASNKGVLSLGALYAKILELGNLGSLTKVFGGFLLKSGLLGLEKGTNDPVGISVKNTGGTETDFLRLIGGDWISSGKIGVQNTGGFTGKVSADDLTANRVATLPDADIIINDWNYLSNIPDATELVKGVSAIASNSEALAGINDTKFITPLKLQAKLSDYVDDSISGTPNYLAKFTGTGNTIGNSIIYESGGKLGINSTSLTGIGLRVSNDITGATSAYGILSDGLVQSNVTSIGANYRSTFNTASSSTGYTTSQGMGFYATQGTIGSNSVVTNLTGFYASSTLIGGLNNFGFYGNIPSGTNRWNLYMPGTAGNYIAGNLWIGTLSSTFKLDVNGTLRVSGTSQFDSSIELNSTILDISNSAGTSGYVLSSTGSAVSWINPTSSLLTGFTVGANSTIAATDTILQAFGKTQGQLNAKLSIADINSYLYPPAAHTHTISDVTGLQSALNAKQALDADLTAIAALTGTGMLKRTGTDSWALDSSSFATGTGTTNKVAKFTSGTSIGDSQITDNGTNVGVQNASPFSKLTITGSNGTSIIALQRTNYGAGASLGGYGFANDSNKFITAITSNYIGSGNTQGYLSIRADTENTDPSALTDRLRVYPSGNVNIGGTTNTYKLDVNGTTSIRGLLYVGSSPDSGTDGQFLKRTSTANAWSTLTIADISDLSTTLDDYVLYSQFDTLWNDAFDIRITSAVSFGSTINISADLNVSSTIYTSSTLQADTGIITSGLADIHNLKVSGYLKDGAASQGTSGYVLSSTGTATAWISPTSSLLTGYTIGSNTVISATDSILQAFGKIQGQIAASVSGSGTPGYLSKYTGALVQGNSVIYESSGNIGIGTTNAVSRLTFGNFSSTSAETVGINFNAGSTAGSLPAYGIGFGPTATEGYLNFRSGVASSSVFGHKWFVNNVEVMRVRGDGRLGIGTTAPAYLLDVAGTGRFSGNVTFDANVLIATAPTSGSHAVNKTYVDALSFIKRGDSVKTISLTNITLSGTQTINGVSLVAGDLILVAGQTTGSGNGVYVVAAGSWSRSTNNDSDLEIRGAYHYITSGTYANQRYINTNTSAITVGTTVITYGIDFGAETDPVWTAFKTANSIDSTAVSNWNTAYGWGNHASAGYVPQSRTITVNGTSGNITSSAGAQDLSSNKTWTLDLATTGIAAGTYKSITIDVYGRATAGTNPTTLSGYGITDALGTSAISGTANRVVKYATSSTLGNSQITDDGTSVGINQTSPNASYKLDVNGAVLAGSARFGTSTLGISILNYSGTTPRILSTNDFDFFAPSNFYWYTTGDVQRMRLTTTGLKIGTGAASYPLDISGNVAIAGALFVGYPSLGISLSSGTDGQFLKRNSFAGVPYNQWATLAVADISDISSNYQAKLSGTGLVRSTAGVISYDTETYLSTTLAASTYLSITNASSTYLTISNAASTYATKTDAVLLVNDNGEIGFKLYADSAKTTTEAFYFTAPDEGIVGIHAYRYDTSTTAQYGLHIDKDGYLYHLKDTGERFRILTTNDLTNLNWDGGSISGDINMNINKNIYWDKGNAVSPYPAGAYIGYNLQAFVVPEKKLFSIQSSDDMGIGAKNDITIGGSRIMLQKGSNPIEFDLSNAISLIGQNVKLVVNSGTGITRVQLVVA